MKFECMPLKDFKALFPFSYQQLVDNCAKDGVNIKSTDNVDVFLDDGNVYEASLHSEESEVKS